MNPNQKDAFAKSVSKSIPDGLEDAPGIMCLCKPAIHKGQMFLPIPSVGWPYRLSEYHRLWSHWRLLCHHPHADVEGKQHKTRYDTTGIGTPPASLSATSSAFDCAQQVLSLSNIKRHYDKFSVNICANSCCLKSTSRGLSGSWHRCQGHSAPFTALPSPVVMTLLRFLPSVSRDFHYSC